MDSLLAIYPTGQKVEEVLKRQSRDRCRLGHRVVTFPELIGTLSREVGDTRLPLAPADERLVIEAVWDHIRTGVTGAAPAHAAWGRNLLQTIRQLKGAALFPEDLARAVSSLGSSAPEYLSILLSAFRGYEEHLRRRHLADAHDRERAVLDFLHRMEDRGSRPKSLEGVSRLLVAEIYDFSLLQFMIVASLIRLIGDAALTIQAQPFEVDASRFAELTWNRFVEDESLSDKVLPEFVCREGRPGMLGFVLRHLFTQSAPSPPPSDQTLTVVETPSRRDEVEYAAREIRRLLDFPAGEQLPLDRIALIARDLEPYRDALRSAFRRYGIPLRLHCETPLISNPLAQFVLRLLRMPLAHYHRDHLVALATSPYLRLRGGENYAALLKQVGYIDEVTALLEERIGSAERELRQACDADKSGRGRASVILERLRRTSPSLLQLLKNLRSLDSSGNAATHAIRLSNLLAELGFDRVAASLSGPNASAARAIGEALEKMACTGESVAPDWDLNLDQFARLVESTFSATVYEEFGAPTNAVQAFSILDARGLDFDLVFILGLNDGVFPCAHAPTRCFLTTRGSR